MWVVKLGGSLAFDPQFGHWLQMLAAHGGGRVVVVTGGASFADAVRDAQACWRFHDLAAHNMAILAMGQTALMAQALEPRLVLVDGEGRLRRALHGGRAAVWMPLSMLRDAPDALTHWDVTSDSLALWLARRLHAERLVVVKSCAIDRSRTLAELGEAGVIDGCFADGAREAAFPIDLVHRDEIDRVRDALVGRGALARAPRAAMPGAVSP